MGMEWLPIESAPKDWERALVWSAKWGEALISQHRDTAGQFWCGDWELEIPEVTHFAKITAPDPGIPIYRTVDTTDEFVGAIIYLANTAENG